MALPTLDFWHTHPTEWTTQVVDTVCGLEAMSPRRIASRWLSSTSRL